MNRQYQAAPAAVVPDTPEHRDVARVVPADASILKVGEAVLGYSRPARRRERMPGWKMNAFHRRGDLQKLAMYRRQLGLAMGPDIGWAFVLGNLCRVLFDHVTAPMIQEEALNVGCGALDAPAVQSAVQEIMGKAWGRYKLWDADQAGAAVQMTSVEREESGVTKIEAIDESGTDRRKRQNREQMARRRAAKAAPKPISKAEIAKELGVSTSTLYRMIRSGDLVLADTVSVCRSNSTPSYYVRDPNTESVSPEVNTESVPKGEGAS